MEKLKKPDTGFAMVSNVPLKSIELSLAAKGLYAYLTSKPNGWQFSSERIASECKECVRTIKDYLQELEACGYLIRKRKSDGRVEYFIQYKPQCKKATVQNLHSEESAPISNTVFNSNTEYNNNIYKAEKSALYDFTEKIKSMKSSKDLRMPIIAKYWQYKGLTYETEERYRVALKRDLRSSNDLKAWDLDKIDKTMFWLNGTKITDWTMETVIKYIDKDLEQLSKNNNFYN